MLLPDYESLYDNTIEGTFLETARDRVAKDVGMKMFNAKDSKKRTISKRMVHGQKGVAFVAESADLPNATGEEGDNISWTQSYYGTNVIVTKHMRTFMMEGSDDGDADVEEVQDIVQTITDDGFDKIDQSFADRILFGHATSYTDVYGKVQTAVTPDGAALFSASHTALSTTFSNLCVNAAGTENVAFSREAVIATRNKALTYKDANGQLRPIVLDTIYHSQDLTDAVERAIFSEKIAGSANNDMNKTTPLKSMKSIEWARLAVDGQGTAKGTYWFMANAAKLNNALKAYFAQKPMLQKSKEAAGNTNWYYPFDYFYTMGTFAPQYIYGSTGAA